MLSNKTLGELFQNTWISYIAWAIWWWEVVRDWLCITCLFSSPQIHLLNCPYCDPQDHLALLFWFSSLSHRREWVRTGWDFGCQLGSTDHNFSSGHYWSILSAVWAIWHFYLGTVFRLCMRSRSFQQVTPKWGTKNLMCWKNNDPLVLIYSHLPGRCPAEHNCRIVQEMNHNTSPAAFWRKAEAVCNCMWWI